MVKAEFSHHSAFINSSDFDFFILVFDFTMLLPSAELIGGYIAFPLPKVTLPSNTPPTQIRYCTVYSEHLLPSCGELFYRTIQKVCRINC